MKQKHRFLPALIPAIVSLALIAMPFASLAYLGYQASGQGQVLGDNTALNNNSNSGPPVTPNPGSSVVVDVQNGGTQTEYSIGTIEANPQNPNSTLSIGNYVPPAATSYTAEIANSYADNKAFWDAYFSTFIPDLSTNAAVRQAFIMNDPDSIQTAIALYNYYVVAASGSLTNDPATQVSTQQEAVNATLPFTYLTEIATKYPFYVDPTTGVITSDLYGIVAGNPAPPAGVKIYPVGTVFYLPLSYTGDERCTPADQALFLAEVGAGQVQPSSCSNFAIPMPSGVGFVTSLTMPPSPFPLLSTLPGPSAAELAAIPLCGNDANPALCIQTQMLANGCGASSNPNACQTAAQQVLNNTSAYGGLPFCSTNSSNYYCQVANTTCSSTANPSSCHTQQATIAGCTTLSVTNMNTGINSIVCPASPAAMASASPTPVVSEVVPTPTSLWPSVTPTPIPTPTIMTATPAFISGPISVQTGVSNNYSFVSTDQQSGYSGGLINYSVNWGDGTSSNSPALSSGSAYTVSHTWQGNGVFNVTVTATPGLGNVSTTTDNVTVSYTPNNIQYNLQITGNSLPAATVGTPYSASVPFAYNGTYALNANWTGLPNGIIGQGLSGSPNQVLGILPNNGSNSNAVLLSGTPTLAGTYSVVLYMTDQYNASTSQTFVLIVNPSSSPVTPTPSPTPTITNSTCSNTAVRVGQLINESGTVYYVACNGVYGVPDLTTFNSWGWNFINLLTPNSTELSLPTLGIVPVMQANCDNPADQLNGACPVSGSQAAGTNPGTFPTGSLVNDSGTIYFIYQNTKIPFASQSAFTGLGYSMSNVVMGNTANYTLDSSYAIASASQAHPWGTWVYNNGTVYYVTQSGLIGVPTWSVFLNNGGKLGILVVANQADLAILNTNTLPVMTNNDSRIVP